jgi:hypothetical protein
MIQNPTASDLSSFISDQDQKNSQLASQARSIPWLPQVDPTWVRDWNAYMTRYVQARETAKKKIATSAGVSLDDVPADSEYSVLARSVKPYETVQSTGDFGDLFDRLRQASARGAPLVSPGRFTWSQIRQKLNNAGAVPALPIVEQGGDDVLRSLQAFQAMNGLPSSGKLTQQTLSYLAAHGEAEKRPDTWRARFGGTNFAGVSSPISDLLKSDVPKYVGAGAVLGLLAKSLGAGLVGTAAAAVGGVALAAYVITHPRASTA